MTAFVDFVRAYAVWLYLVCAAGIILGIKMLADARHMARTTMFSLEQERAGDQSLRAITVVAIFVLAMVAIAAVSAVLGPLVRPAESPILRGPTQTLVVSLFPSGTPLPTATIVVPTEQIEAGSPPAQPPPTLVSSAAAATPTRPTVTPAPPLPSPTTPSPYQLPAPIPDPKGAISNNGVYLGEGRKTVDLKFQWTWNCDQCTLGPDDRFVVVISYTDKSGRPVTIGGGTKANYLTMADIMRGSGLEVFQQAKEGQYSWYVQVKQGDVPLSPPSAVWQFKWY